MLIMLILELKFIYESVIQTFQPYLYLSQIHISFIYFYILTKGMFKVRSG